METPRISVVIPVYNEEGNLPELFRELTEVLEKLSVSFEIIFIDDGSKDRSGAILRGFALQDGRVRIIFFQKNFGQSAAFAAGFRSARGEIVVTMDADLQNDPHDIPLLLDKITSYDMVCGWRVHRQDSLVRKISSRIANKIRNWLSDEQIKDVGCSLKAFRRECLRNFYYFKGMHRFFPTLMKIEGCSVTEVKVNHRPRRFGEAKYGIGNRAFRGLIDLLAVRWMKKRHLSYEVKEIVNG
ncbi:MAG: glycosyltransferase family 2 protein [Thermodesulfobacteriota bacterium]|jgi:glycosyltransferase involved in cell wall biosynthesis|nr:MAG: glycosyltransferase family 2 protein [Thermodesulfobacteriota bacterium]